jgi:hypothetical protein
MVCIRNGNQPNAKAHELHVLKKYFLQVSTHVPQEN